MIAGMIELAAPDYRALVEAIAAELAPALDCSLAATIEATLLSAGATAADIELLCDQAAAWGVAAVCVAPCHVALAAERLRATPVLVVAAVGFPLGSATASAKRYEAAECVKLGADELDVVINLGALKSGDSAAVRLELAGVVELAHAARARVKAILELPLLTAAEQERAVQLALDAGVDFLKTATGTAGPATVAQVELLRRLAGGRARIKAAGGIRTPAQARALIAAGADRLGTSQPQALLGN